MGTIQKCKKCKIVFRTSSGDIINNGLNGLFAVKCPKCGREIPFGTYKRRHVRDVAIHIDIATRDALRAWAPKDLTNDDQRLSYLLSKV